MTAVFQEIPLRDIPSPVSGRATDVATQRSSSVRVSSPEPLEPGSGHGRDSLIETREYYGLSPMAGPSTSQSHRSRSMSGRQSHNRSTSNATSRLSSTSRPTSPDAKRPISSMSARSAVPLPLYRGFLSPKKPKAAIRLEQRQREASASREQHPQGEEEEAAEGGDAGLVGMESGRISEEARGSLPSQPEGEPEDLPHTASTSDGRPNGHASSGFPEPIYGRPPNIRHSLAEQSSQHATHAEYSSDDLVPTRHNQYPSSGTYVDEEKGHGHAHPRHAKLSPPRRPSYHERGSSRRSSRNLERPQRRYQLFENPLSTFLFKGHAMTGGDNLYSVGLVLVLLFGITGVWFGTTGVWYWRYAGEYGMAKGGGVAIDIIFVYLFGLTLSSFLAASLREPGIIPRDLDPSPPMSQGETDSWRQPLDREFAVKQGRVVVRYCETCRSYRPPRASHCRLCGNCVDGIDHHCSYLQTCVGKRTYLAFLTLLVSAFISAIYQVVFSAIHFSLLCHGDSIGFGTALQRSPGAAVSFLIGVAVLPGIGFLLIYHLRLLLYNLTTVEQIRASASSNLLKATKRPDNPFAADSILSNVLLSTLGRPQFPSWVQGWKVVQPERRTVNPALTEERWVKMGYDKGMR
ncbi:DHHC palmitoyltransferase-domain-containing protein [Dioszegia hungarica]|uniref:Palmitoyltransferase n=1 Tax=Dioszegia hungarica TaxID=4972 RepID=A0AA38HDL5_9TREE|nr:DHHC palmitoyltransferase-domain-containing protein [Dioszegia hungarica]KAI9639773.1 DHHC palmitoyltransferase-domain-containing protein [Dioszegia hungarica]